MNEYQDLPNVEPASYVLVQPDLKNSNNNHNHNNNKTKNSRPSGKAGVFVKVD